MSRRSRVTSSNGNPAESLESRLLFAIPEPNDTFDHAYTPPDNIYLETIYYPQDSVHNTADRSDFYKFYNLYGKSNLYLALSTTGSASGEDVDLYVWDANRNLIKAGYSSFGSESFTVDLPANQYFYVEVRKFSGVSANYSLYLQNDYAGSTLATARDIGASQGQSGDRSGLYAQTGFFEVMDYRDATDVYKFRMEAPGTVSLRQPPATAGGVPLSTSVQLLDASGNVLANGVRSGGATSIDRVTLNTGTYYARIQQLDGSGTFNFRIVSDYAGDTAGTARNLGDLTNQSRRMFDMVGGPGLPVSYTDELDLYKFTFNKAAPLDLVLDIPDSFTAPTFDADLFLGRDLNGNGFIESGEIINTAATTSDDELHYSSLNAGTYYVGVRQCGAYTSYQLDLDSDFDAPLGSAAGYKDMSDAQSLGALVGQTDFNGGFGVSFGDSSDFYKFTLAATAVVKVGAARNGFYSRDEVTPYVTILRDGNGNFLYDTTEKIAAGAGGATATLPPGTYYVAIQGYGQANYYGQITADAAGNTLAAARAFAAVSGATPATQTFKDYVEQDFGAGSDPNDFYTFTLPSTYAVTLKTTGVAGEDSALALIRDANNNGTIDSGDVLATANVANSSNETITRTLTAGKYFARFSGVNGGTNYTLAASFASGAGGTPDPDDAIGEIATGSGNNKSLGQFADFSINPADDVDLVKFTVAAGQKVGFDVDSRDGSALDTVLRLFNAGGTQLASNDNGAAPGEPASNFSYLTHTFAAAGTYFIGVSNKGNAAYNPTTGGGDAAGTGPLGAYRLYLNNLGITPAGTFQAETQTLAGGTAASSASGGFTGSGYADFGPAGSSVQFGAVPGGTAGVKKLTFRYANGGTVNRPADVYVNGAKVGFVSFGPTGSWTAWGSASLNANLLAGNNVIKLIATASAGGPNVDQLAVTAAAAASAVTYQAESASIGGGSAVRTAAPGYNGSGYVGYGGSGSYAQFAVTRATAGASTFAVRYANGGTASRPLTLSINGTTITTVAFPPTGSWLTWGTTTFTANLLAGTNAVRLTAGSAAGVNMDQIVVTPV